MKKVNETALVFAFTLMAIVLGTTEYIIVGLLTEIAASLKVTVAAAGALVSGFALAYGIGTPVLMTFVSRFPKKRTILTLIALIVGFNLLSAVSTTFFWLLVTRIITAILCGLSISLALSAVSVLVSAERQGKAVSYILGGFGIANVLGVPVGTWVGQHWEWPAAFVLTAALGSAAFLLNWMTIPAHLPGSQASLKEQIGLLADRRILLALFIPILGIGAAFSLYTYVRPLMADFMEVAPSAVSGVLLAYGVATIFSTWMGGKVATGNSVGKLRIVFLVQAAVYAVFYFAAPLPIPGLMMLILCGAVSSLLNVTAQLYLIELSVERSPASRDFAASLNPVASNFGIAFGSGVGGVAMEQAGVSALPWTAMIIALAAFAVTAVSYSLRRKAQTRQRQELPLNV
ncbi:MFS transporter ['Paenibacillus yunnanensis' Narsing Rao et al. 2020]|uniref:MFS transporter n=1 Tax=Paenibacillus tengchongensis TaxID=2608684 RepID=UPI00124C0133|nr:MFS transporter [Paenibacillus tengchongensis]